MAETEPSRRPMRPVKRTPFEEELLPVQRPQSADSEPPRQEGAGAAAQKKWDVPCVTKILCPNDKKIVEQLAQTTVTVADAIYFDDPYYDGTRWIPRRFLAGGTSDADAKQIGIMSGASCEEAATTFYHEIWHQNQPKTGMTFEEREYDAYHQTEQWTIDRGLPSQSGDGSLRAKDAKGRVVPSRKGVEAHVHKHYPVPPKTKGTPPPRPVGQDATGNTILSNGTKRPPRKGDTYPGPEKVVDKRVIPPGTTARPSPWKCS